MLPVLQKTCMDPLLFENTRKFHYKSVTEFGFLPCTFHPAPDCPFGERERNGIRFIGEDTMTTDWFQFQRRKRPRI